MKVSLSKLASVLDVSAPKQDCVIDGVSIDSRDLSPGCLFVAVKGEQFDGHDFVQKIDGQAAACLVSRPVDTALPSLQVADTLEALSMMGHWWRQQYAGPVCAITGSCGKTTTRALLSAILATQGPLHASPKSYNNHIGVPLTLLGIRSEHTAVVAEVGTNGPGEIAALADMIEPTVSVITLAAPVHLEGLGSLSGVVWEKGALVRALKPGTTAVLNADDPAFSEWQAMVPEGVRVVSFGMNHQADVMLGDWEATSPTHSRAKITIAGESLTVELALIGRHHGTNVGAACAAAYALGLPLASMAEGLPQAVLPPHRLVGQAGWRGAWIIDDSFNANPVAVRAAMDVLMASPQEKKILVLGDMGELGDEADAFHRAAGEQARELGVDALFLYGEQMRHAQMAFGEAAMHFSTKEALITALKKQLDDQTAVLIKGSHSMHMDEVAQACLQMEEVS